MSYPNRVLNYSFTVSVSLPTSSSAFLASVAFAASRGLTQRLTGWQVLGSPLRLKYKPHTRVGGGRSGEHGHTHHNHIR